MSRGGGGLRGGRGLGVGDMGWGGSCLGVVGSWGGGVVEVQG